MTVDTPIRPAEATPGRIEGLDRPTAVGLTVGIADGDGRFVVLRRGDQAWIVPLEPNGWMQREPWNGDIDSVRWIGGPPALAMWRSVGAPE